jgi:ssDNA-binding Zn-finger/Zn-ribbon topoisomerase 1
MDWEMSVRADIEAKRRAMWEAKGYEVQGTCPECGHGLIIRKLEAGEPAGRWVCTSYAQCELSVG